MSPYDPQQREYCRLRTYGPTGDLLTASDHASPHRAGEQAAKLSHVSLEWEEDDKRVEHRLAIRTGAGLDSDAEREAGFEELGDMLAGMEAVGRQVDEQLKQRYGS